MRSPFPAHSPSGHGVGDCWCQDPATGPTLLAAVALVDDYERRLQVTINGKVQVDKRAIDALAAAVRRETP